MEDESKPKLILRVDNVRLIDVPDPEADRVGGRVFRVGHALVIETVVGHDALGAERWIRLEEADGQTYRYEIALRTVAKALIEALTPDTTAKRGGA